MSRRQGNRRTQRHAGPAAVFYACEVLESRTLLNAVPAGVIGMHVVIQGDGGDDTITLSSHTVRFFARVQPFVDWMITGGRSPSTGSVAVGPTDSVFVETGGGKVTG